MSSKKSKQSAHTNKATIGKTHIDQKTIIPDNSVTLKAETLRWLFSIIGALLVYFVIAYVVLHTYHPDIQALVAAAAKISFIGNFRPKPVETLLFHIGVITITGGIAFFYAILSKSTILKKLATEPFFLFITAVCVLLLAGLIYIDFSAANPFAAGGPEQPQNSRDLVAATNFSFYFSGLFLGDNFLLFTFMFVPLVALIFYYGVRKNRWQNNNLLNKVLSSLAYISLGIILLLIVLINTCEFPYTADNIYDFNAVYYSVTQVFAGLPMLVNGFSNTYGLYPHFLNPLFQIIGLSIFKFSFVMSLITGAAFLLNFLFLKKYVENKIIWFLGCCTILFFPYLDNRILIDYDSYFAFYPIRYIIPSVLTFLAALYLNRRSQTLYLIIYIIMGFFILWNPEIGTVCFLSWLFFNIYNDFYLEDGSVSIKKNLKHCLFGVIVVAAVFTLYKLIVYMTYGSSPDLIVLFTPIMLFGKLGFNLLPLALLHPWNITILIITLGFTYSIAHLYKKNITNKSSIIFLVSLISLGCFFYFQGRSHNWTFATSSGFSLILLTILGNELWKKIKDQGRNLWPLHLLFIIFLFLISFSFFELLPDIKKITALVYQEDFKEKMHNEQARINSNTDFILKNSKEKERIYICTAPQYQGLYFDGNKRQSAFNPGEMDMFLNDNLETFKNKIIDSSFKAFIEPALFNLPFYNLLLAAFAASYEVKDTNQGMYMLNKRKIQIPVITFLGQGNDVVIHEKYKDDGPGIRSRINDAFGIRKVDLAPVFSVEVLFYASKQIYPYATLIGNMNDSSGFIIAKIINTPNYFFGINGKGAVLKINDSQWVYCAMNIYPDRFEIYQNGNLAGVISLSSPMRQSTEKFSIGNMGYLRNYIGAIAEVAIYNKALDAAQIKTTWSEIAK